MDAHSHVSAGIVRVAAMIFSAIKLRIGSLICTWYGHQRGKCIHAITDPSQKPRIDQRKYQCPRCGATWIRKIKVAQ